MQTSPPDDKSDKHPWLVLGIGAALWMYSTLSDLVAHNFLQRFLEKWNVGSFTDIQSRLLQHVLMLPLLVGVLYVALHVYRKSRHWLASWTFYIACAVLYGLCIRPLEVLAVYIEHGSYNYFDPASPSLIYELTTPVWYLYGVVAGNAAICLLGMTLVLSLSGQLALSQEKLRLERLNSEFLAVKLKTLQWQLNPHFVFNSLNTVSALLRSAPGKADRVLTKFSELLRMTLREQERIHTSVSSELEYVHCYLNLETIRFEDRLKLRIETDENALDGSMPSFLLQPLIENAIKHGIAKIPGPALITVNVGRQGERLVFAVRNTSSRQYAGTQSGPGGLGIRNMQERLATLYQDAFIFRYGYAEDDDWSAVIEIPYARYEVRK
ncbi:MAG: sensor histidine kinase [Gammaproteobacteria bacterium]